MFVIWADCTSVFVGQKKSMAPRIVEPPPNVPIVSVAVLRVNSRTFSKDILNYYYIKDKMTSRLIVRNLPKHLKESELRKHFSRDSKYEITDAKIMYAGTKTRQFGFVGFKTPTQAEEALSWFNNTFLHTSKIMVETAKQQGDGSIPRPWSKHSVGSSAYNKPKTEKKEHDPVDKDAIEAKK